MERKFLEELDQTEKFGIRYRARSFVSDRSAGWGNRPHPGDGLLVDPTPCNHDGFRKLGGNSSTGD